MKKIVITTVLILVYFGSFAQDISGQWNGLLKIQGYELRLVFNILLTDEGYSATMDSPDQGVKGIPVSSVNFENMVLKLEVSEARIQYEGTYHDQQLFEGTFKQAGQSVPFVLSKEVVQAKKLIRPQEPTKPYPYHTEDVTFKNKRDDIILAGTLTLPKKKGNFPAVVLISGSGPQNRDEEIMGHKPFLIISDFLTRNGFAVLRFDDRGTADSKGYFASATTFDFAIDVASAVNYLKKRKEIDKEKIGLIGHSEGGIIAPIVAAASDDVSYIVLLAGTGIPGHELLLLQQELIGRAMGVSESDLITSKRINENIYQIILSTTHGDLLTEKLTNYLMQSIADFPASSIPEGISDVTYVEMLIEQLCSPWMLNFITYDPSQILEKVDCPVLAINGSKDLQVPPKENLNAIKKALEKGGNQNFTIKELPNLNHLFQESETGSPNEYAQIDQTFSPIALNEILTWLKMVVK